tara:strand:- start:64598 stop:66136 length:1539 start_codon:yes stop_codon:yes gene_type:complete
METTPKSQSTGSASKIVMEGITFDDVLLIPQASNVMPATAVTSTRLTKDITLNIPMVSAPMDTVTESELAIGLAQEGGIGIIHKNLPIEAQAREVIKVKRSANGVISDPITLGPTDTVARAIELMHEYKVSGFPITADGANDVRSKGKLMGILTRRDLKFAQDETTPISEIMTSENLVTAPAGTTLAQAEGILNQLKVEKLLLVDDAGCLDGLITMRDIERQSQFPNACVDSRGRLRVGAAVGPNQMDRVAALIEAEVDVLVVDTAHGHSGAVIEAVKEIKAKYDIGVIAGNIATGEAAIALAQAGADAIKVGIGPGSICTTRVVTGVGMPQVTAIMNAVDGLRSIGSDITVIADGGIRLSGDIAKAIAAGAHCVMMGSLFAGLDESPGELVISGGRRYKSYRGMGSEGAMNNGSADRYRQSDKLASLNKGPQKFVPEGVEGLVAYRGTLAEFVYQLVGGMRSAMGYCGCPTIDSFRTDARFVRVSGATVVENHPHDIKITKESPNYTMDRI